MAVANLGFVVILADNTYADITDSASIPVLYLSMISVMVASVGFASYLVQRNSGFSGLNDIRKFISRPPKQFIAYLLIVSAWTASIGFSPVKQIELATSDGIVFHEIYDSWFILASLLLLTAFLTMPVLTFYRTARQVMDSKAASSMRIISFAWALFGAVAFLQAVVEPRSFQPVGQLTNAFLFLLISFALREPTVLSRIVNGGEPDASVYSTKNSDLIILYNGESDRTRLVQEFLRAGPNTQDETTCYVAKAEVPIYRALSQESRAKIVILPIEASSFNMDDQPEPSESRRELIDLADLDFDLCKQYIERIHLIQQGVKRPRARTWAVNVEAEHQRVIDEIRRISPEATLVNLAGNRNSFSRKIGMVHEDLQGARILFEYDPTLDFEQSVGEFASEFLANVVPVAVFTSLGSPIEKQLNNQQNVRMFIFSTKISTPSRVSETRVLLPERETSLLLDAVDKLVQAHKDRHVALVIEAITDLVLSQGFEKSYGVLSSIVEIAQAGSSTTLVLLNHTCLEERVLQGVRGLFKYQVRHGPDGLKILRSGNLANSAIPAELSEETRLGISEVNS